MQTNLSPVVYGSCVCLAKAPAPVSGIRSLWRGLFTKVAKGLRYTYGCQWFDTYTIKCHGGK